MVHLPYESPIGTLLIVASPHGVVRIDFPNKQVDSSPQPFAENRITRQIAKELDAYFDGLLQEFSTPLDTQGTPFQQKVWMELRNIPQGETCSYGSIARKIGSPLAFRAVGMANNKNPTPIIVPCHRVIGASGKLVGFGGELWRKEWLLNHEFKLVPSL